MERRSLECNHIVQAQSHSRMRRCTRVDAAAVILAAAMVAAVASGLQGAQVAPAPATQRKPLVGASVVPDEVRLGNETVGKRVPPKAGDVCRVCNNPVHDGDIVFVVRGQRVPLHLGELGPDLRGQLEGLLAQLEPRGAFLGARRNHPALSTTWFLLGLYILLGLIFAALCAHRALHTGQSPVAWFALGLALNAFAYFALLTRPRREVVAPSGVPAGLRKISATFAPQPCSKCGAQNHPSAAACIGCGTALEPRAASEVARAGLRPR